MTDRTPKPPPKAMPPRVGGIAAQYLAADSDAAKRARTTVKKIDIARKAAGKAKPKRLK